MVLLRNAESRARRTRLCGWITEFLPLIAFLALLWIPSSLRAQQVSGNSLYGACQSDEGIKLGFCIGFIIGAIEGESFGASIVFMRTQPESTTQEVNDMINAFMGHCIPTDASNQQLHDVIMRYLGDHPEQRHLPARGLVWNAMIEAFPCEQ